MQLYQLTQLATQQGYLRALHELEAMQHSIDLQERLIDQINQLDNIQAAPALRNHTYGTPGIEIQIEHIEQIKTINALIESHGWSKCDLHPSIEPHAHYQVWMARDTKISTNLDDSAQEHRLHGFAIEYLAKEVQ
ncbi:hypothetical protein [Deefgea rivuli]|uniref:hypothetical protein n=1 Tax=Deefgea rivuli TaxID=400948 RepID=UPI00048712EA|nr:hypothetical protein [Deefgea rivuli]